MILSAVYFLLCGTALVFATVLERRRDPEVDSGRMFERALSDRTTRIAVLLIWWWLGWHFLAGQTL